MAIDWDNTIAFPINVTEVLVARLGAMDAQVNAVNRGVRKIDPNFTVGVFPESWQPAIDAKEFLGEKIGPMSISTLNEYYIQIHSLIKGVDQVKVQRYHSILCRAIRDVVEFDQPFRVALASLPGVTVGNKVEIFKEFETLTQTYFPLNDASTTWIYLGALRCKITTETQIG